MSRGGRLSGAGPSARPPERVNSGAESGTDPGRTTDPVRTCVGCRVRGPRSVLLRVVAVADDAGQVRAVVDTRRVLPGRGAWVHADPRCLELAERRRAIARALRVGSIETEGLRAEIERAAEQGGGPERPSVESSGSGSGLEADGHPMSTQR
ncbi:MAG: YlxR family protein [Actinomycetales bacterium]|nr:YlxR family protein [Actinomycetales bacterium]